MLPSYKSDHAEDSLTFLTEVFKTKPVIEGILKSAVASIQTAENMIWDIINSRNLNTATGAQLDLLGELVGEPRKGRTEDEEYREAIRLRVRINRSQGRTSDILDIAKLALGDSGFTYSEPATATFVIKYYEAEQAKVLSLINAINDARPAGVYGQLWYTTDEEAHVFKYAHTDGIILGKGYDSNDGSQQSNWISVAPV